MNNITVAGNLTRDAELRHTSSGDSVLSFTVADNGSRKDQKAIYWSCSLWGKRAEALQPYLRKGDNVTIAGVVSQREYTDKAGQPRMSLDVRVSEIALQGGKPTGTGSGQVPYQTSPAPTPRSSGAGDFDTDGDIPF